MRYWCEVVDNVHRSPNAEKLATMKLDQNLWYLDKPYKSGKVTGVVYADKNGVTHEQKQKLFVLLEIQLVSSFTLKFRI